MAEIRLENLHKRFGDFVAVRDTNLTIGDGEFFVLLGPSGCGKTTTLRMTAGLEIPSDGRILLDEEDVTRLRASRRDIAFVFQLFALYPHMNVRQNLDFPLRSEGVGRTERRRRVEEVATLLRIGGLLASPVSKLSGGDRQRVALGRAIIRRPKAFLMDEPLGTLDTELREAMREELRQLHDRIGATTVYVTHDQIEAMTMADRVAVMNDGVVLQAGPPQELYSRPANMFVAGFLGAPAMNFLPAKGSLQVGASSLSVAGAEIAMPALREGLDGDEAVLGVRPEHIALDDRGGLRGEVYGVEYMGSHQVVTVDTGAGRLRLRSDHRAGLSPRQNVGLNIERDGVVVFDPASERALSSETQRGAGHG